MLILKNNTPITNGTLLTARQQPSPNYNDRPDVDDISLLVIHNISLPPQEFGGTYIEDFFCNCLDYSKHPYFYRLRSLNVSSHLLIDRSGHTMQFVNFAQRAWHAGVSSYEGRSDCNDFSIGIELEGSDNIPYTEEQYRGLIKIVEILMRHYPLITPERIVGHIDIAPERKTDPGPAFDWQYFRQQILRYL